MYQVNIEKSENKLTVLKKNSNIKKKFLFKVHR